MGKLKSSHLLIIALIIIGGGAIIWWLTKDPVSDLTISMPGTDNRGSDSLFEEDIKIGSLFESFSNEVPELSEVWACFRGVNRDNISNTKAHLKSQLDENKLPIVWKTELGEGHAGAAIYKGQVFVLDYMEKEHADMLRCFNLETGNELWRRGYKVKIKRNHGMSRTVPSVTEDYVVTIGPRCQVMCVDRKSGDFKWGIDIEKEYQTEEPLWYTGQCPYIDNGKVIIATGGKALIIAVDCETGEKLWEVPNDNNWQMSHASVMPFTFKGKKMYVYSAVGGVCGVSAQGVDEGKILWQTSEWNHSVVAPSALCLPDGKIFLTAGYGAGSMVIQLNENDGRFSTKVLDEFKPKDGLACEQQTPVVWNGHVFGIMPKEGGMNRNQFVCVDPKDFRTMVWTSGKDKRYGLGPYFMADDKFYLLNDDATLTIIEPSVTGFKELDEVKLFDGQDAWAPLATADGYLVLRDSKTMICLDMHVDR
ncbi:PQQ-binding-like beta-propeller repeat protein [Saccharicrinis sp. FJH2]|uniref:outer membrane protein assembly factor BamB family protein n=1 Tax=Saccharicrinis sp. FJH65 TaxID=3344659 RepID=UPI0035F368BA